MASSSQLVGGGGRLNIDTDQDGNTLTNMDSSEKYSTGRSRQTNQKAVFTTKFAKTIVDNPNDTERVRQVSNAIIDLTDSGSFLASKDGAIMGITAAGIKGLKATGLLNDKEIANLSKQISQSPKGEGLTKTDMATAAALTISGGLLLNKATNNVSKRGVKAIWNKGASLNPLSGDKAPDESGDKKNKGPKSTPDDKTSKHGKSFVSDNDIISKRRDTSKFISDGVGGMKPSPNYTKPKFIQTLERKIV